MFKIIPNKRNIGAEAIGNIKDISKKDFKTIFKSLEVYGMIFLRRQKLSSSDYIKFAKHFGKLADYPRLKNINKSLLFKEKQQIRDPVLENSFIQTLFTQKNLQDLQCYYLN
jgi:alpha-ketoglutarate-dependent taurine dioxygenase